MIIGSIAFAGLIVAWGLFAYRRHRLRNAQAVDAAAALRSGPGGARPFMLDEDEDDQGNMHFVGAGSVSRGTGSVRYDRLRGGNNLDAAAEDGTISPVGDTRGQDVAGGGDIGLEPVPIVGGRVGQTEDASLMHPANRSAVDITQPGEFSPISPRSRVQSLGNRSSAGPGPDPAEWLGGRVASYPDMKATGPLERDSTQLRSMSPQSLYSDEGFSSGGNPSGAGHMSSSGHSHSMGSPIIAAAAAGAVAASIGGEHSSHGHEGYASSSTHGHGATGSSSGGHGSSSGHKTGPSSSGHPMSTTTHTSSSPIMPRPPGPSSLLPTQTAPPSSYRDVEDEAASPAGTRRKSSLFGSLRGLRLRTPRASVTSLPATVGLSGPASASPRHSVYDIAYSPRTSIVRPQSPTLGSLPPRPAFRPDMAIPEGAAPPTPPGAGPLAMGIHARTASGAPIWPGLGPLAPSPDMPSPALTDVSGRAPEGLLNPKWLNAEGMQSQGAISFRDDMDYSRPIGGVSVSSLLMFATWYRTGANERTLYSW